ncbi:hypothetical protein AZF04_07325 [Alkalihalobacillus trypoxylicola]|uniref:CAAX prenyl protease 2/Lysostaphin resistance protein A-like domain-containing protein n=1 Tax=Alkalihalobacillus trypoxylicola TaxID=519424 RepID=A0A161QIJ8_9BACI|nr:hypothetical protein AZF04_07325 [Alkalihalobacillus trypoxylicola]
MATITLLLIYVFADKIKLSYLNLKRTGKMRPSLLLTNKKEGKWETDAWDIAIIMIILIGVFSYFQTYSLGFNFSLITILMVFPIAASNAFIEEIIFRLSYVTMGDNEALSPLYGILMGSIVFGFIHYSGAVPNGLFGVLLSAYLGYFLSKSIYETKGFYWAFFIHFLLDVVILMFILHVNM